MKTTASPDNFIRLRLPVFVLVLRLGVHSTAAEGQANAETMLVVTHQRLRFICHNKSADPAFAFGMDTTRNDDGDF